MEGLVVQDGCVAGIRGHSKDGKSITELARLVIGADGRYSLVADAVGAEEYNEKPQLQVSYYTYWSGLPMSGRFETTIRPGLGYAAWPTNDDLTLVIAGRSIEEFDAVKRDIEGTYLPRDARDRPSLCRAGSRRQARGALRRNGRPRIPPQALRPRLGSGRRCWLQQGLHPAQGIHDAFRDAELCATALDEALEGGGSLDAALGEYQARRDEQVLPMYEFTAELAALAPPPPELQKLLNAVSRSQEAMDGFARVAAGVTSPVEFFSNENAERILAAAA